MTAKRQQPRWFYLFAALLFLVLLGLNARDYLQGDPAGDRFLDLFLCGMDGLLFFLLLARFAFWGSAGRARDRLLEGCLDLLLLAAWACGSSCWPSCWPRPSTTFGSIGNANRLPQAVQPDMIARRNP